MKGFLGIPDLEAPQDGYAPIWSAVVGRAKWAALTGAMLTGFAVNQIPVGTSVGGLAGSSALTFNGTTLAVNGAGTFSTTLDVTGAITGSSTAAFASNVTVGGNAVAATRSVIFNTAAGQDRSLIFQSAGVRLWQFYIAGTGEVGADAGANLRWNAYTDAGVLIDIPFQITRAAGGAIALTRPVSLSTASSGITISITSGTSLIVSSTTASSGGGTGCATFAGGITVNGSIFSDAGRIVAGSSAVQVCLNGTTTVNPFLQCNNTSASAAAISNTRWSANSQGAATIYAKSRGAAVGTRGIVSNNDTLAQLVANGDDGTSFREAGQINFAVDGATISATSMPGRIVFLTTPSGSVTPVEALRLDSTQLATFAGGVTLAGNLTGSGSANTISASATTVTIGVTNTNAAVGTIFAAVTMTNDAGVVCNNRVYGSAANNTIFGITMANWVTYVGTTASVAGMLIGPTGSSTAPLVFGVGANETARFNSGTLASGVFSVSYTLDATAVGTAGVTLASGLSVAKAVFAGGAINTTSTTDSTTIATGSIITLGGVGVAKRLTLDGGTGKTLKYVNGTANAAVAVTFGAVGPTGSTAGNQQGWLRVDVNGTDRFVPYW